MATVEETSFNSRPPLANRDTRSETFQPPARVVVREIIETLLLTLFIFWLVNAATGRYRVQGHSMLPTLHEGEYLIINKLSYQLDEPVRGDIIVLHYPRDPSREYIKRIIGLPGDRVEIGDGGVWVNGVLLDEPYLEATPTYRAQSWTVPDDQFFVLGDNRNNSSDSRDWSFLSREEIVGKAWLIYWGVDDWGMVPHYSHLSG
ncbi:MAG: signal peptidase I [Candidatus Promineifilaceae bacterium]|nr:signal peptidase I [Candidatus Promineifilaceae bacterium]